MTGHSAWIHALTVVLCLLLGVNCESEEQPQCGDGMQFQDRCYWISSEWAGWNEAVRCCHQRGPNVQLTVISSQEEQDWLHSILPNDEFWIGLHDLTEEGHWLTADGMYPNYTNWAPFHPIKSTYRNCAIITHEGGYWEEDRCSYGNRYICSSTSEIPHCHSGSVLFRGQCYWQLEEEVPWTDAQDACTAVDEGAQMVIIRDGELNTFLSRFLYRIVWIGLHYRTTEGQWEWIDGSKPTFTNWERNQPDNRGNSDCVNFSFESTQWRAETCTYPGNVVCASPSCGPEGLGNGGPCGNETQHCSCVSDGHCLRGGKCHCLKKFPDMVCDKANVRVQLSAAKVHVNEGESIELTCHVNIPKADHSLQVQHAKSHDPHSPQELPEDRTEFYMEKNETGYYKVVIHNATTEDSGVYICTVSTTAGVLPVTRVDSAFVTVRSITGHHHFPKPKQDKGGTSKNPDNSDEGGASKNPTENNSAAPALSVAVALLSVGCILAIIALVAIKIRARRREQLAETSASTAFVVESLE